MHGGLFVTSGLHRADPFLIWRYEIAGLTVDPNQNKLVYDFCRKLEDETLADWYDQMFYFVRAEMECYTNMLLLMQDIEEDEEWRKEDFVEPDDNV